MTFNTPNVYVQEQSGLLPSSISNADTIPAFIGYTENGPLNTPTRITSLSEYEATFGGARNEEGLQVTVQDTEDSQTVMVKGYSTLLYDSLYHSVQMFFANGGGACYIVSITPQSASQTKLIADDGVTEQQFGGSLAFSGNTLLIGATSSFIGVSPAVYVFERQLDGITWLQVNKILPPAGSNFGFGTAISLSDDGMTLLIGNDNDNIRQAYIYKREVSGTTWSLAATLNASDETTDNLFGDSLVLTGDGNTAIIGAPRAEVSSIKTGAVYIFEQQGESWSQVYKLSADDGLSGDSFGTAVAFSGDTILIGASLRDEVANASGAAYIFERQSNGSWLQTAKLFATDGQEHDIFGHSVALSGDTALIGQPDDEETRPGWVYVFERQSDGVTWSRMTRFRPDVELIDGFGYSISLCGDLAMVGAIEYDSGQAYVFKRQGDNSHWSQVSKITVAGATMNDQLGRSVLLVDNTAFAGAVNATGQEAGSGVAYVNDLDGLTFQSYQTALATLTTEEEVNLLVFPHAAKDLCDDAYYQLCQAALSQAATLKDRFVIMDTTDSISDAGERFREGIGENNLDYGAVYYPHVQTTLPVAYADDTVTVSHVQSDGVTASTYDGYSLATLQGANDLLYNQITLKLDGLGVTMPASGAMAGVYARMDHDKGVWKAPANTSLANVSGPTVKLSDAEQASFNVDETTGKSVNVIRSFDGRGTLVWGGRTLDGNDHDWRYISTKRLLIQIEKDLQALTTATIGEANIARNWAKLKGLIESYLMDLWQRGGLMGSSAEEAYFIGLGAGETMTEVDVANGILKITLGVAATRPAEFVIITFTQKL